MNKVTIIIILTLQFTIHTCLLFSQGSGYITLDGRQFKDENGVVFIPKVCNYIVELVYNGQPNGYHLSPEHSFGASINFECINQTTCDQDIINDFTQIKSMGFNTIRLAGLAAKFDSISLKFTVPRNELYFNNIMPQYFVIDKPYLSINNQSKYFEKINHFLELAYANDLKVILITGGNLFHFDVLFEDLYTEYLESLASYIHSYSSSNAKKALLAYDYFNEPLYSNQVKWPEEIFQHTKNDICLRTGKWYNALKLYDPNHLITMGGNSFEDIFEYDLSVIKVDFYSPHFYPLYKQYENLAFPMNNYDFMLNRVKGHIYWLNENTAYPWIIGETGFLAQSQLTPPIVDGSLQEQADYAYDAFSHALDCNASGFSWWIYQNLYWSIATASNGNFYGLLDYGLCMAPCSTSSIEKPIANTLRNFNNTGNNNCIKPGNYYDPHNHNLLTSTSNSINGIVIDQFGNPIENAVIVGHNRLVNSNNIYFSYTFTDEFGVFTIKPFGPNRTPLNIGHLQISSPGSHGVVRGGLYLSGYPPISNNETYVLQRNTFKYDNSLYNILYNANNFQSFIQGYHSVTLKDITFDANQNINSNITARNSIDLLDEVLINEGNEVLIYLSETMPDCNSYSSTQRVNNSTTTSTNESTNYNETIVTYRNDGNPVYVYPNPSHSFIEILENSFPLRKYKYYIYDMKGRLLKTDKNYSDSKINIEYLEDGIYLIHLEWENNIRNLKLIKL